MRLDLFLVKNNLCKTRSKAADLIKTGFVFVNGKIIKKSGFNIKENDKIEVVDSEILTNRFVSRAGIKLYYALKYFGIDVKEKICLDVGASTGGFTDCLIQLGAKKVFSVDVGKNQLDKKLLTNPKITSFEQTDIRNFTTEQKFDFICVDVSFISLKKIIPVIIKFAKEKCDFIFLIKPQFELLEKIKNFKGVVKDKEYIKKIIDSIIEEAQKNNLKLNDIIESPIKGKEGNIEYLGHFKNYFY